MKIYLFLTALIAFLHESRPYILLTASVDDVEDLAKQLSESPVVDELHRIWRRASQQFRQQLRRPSRHQERYESDYNGRRSNVDDTLVALGKNASVYVKAFKKMMDYI